MAHRTRNPNLTERETAVLTGLLMGHTNKRISADLGSTDSTVKVHVKGILRKLRCSTRTEAVMLVMRAALLEPCPRCGYVDPAGPVHRVNGKGD